MMADVCIFFDHSALIRFTFQHRAADCSAPLPPSPLPGDTPWIFFEGDKPANSPAKC